MFYGLLSILKASKYIYIYTRLVEALHKQLFMYEIFFASLLFMISYFLSIQLLKHTWYNSLIYGTSSFACVNYHRLIHPQNYQI